MLLKRDMRVLTSDDPSCTSLDYSRWDGKRYFDDSAVRILCTSLLTHTHIESIDLSTNLITSEGASYLADVLRINPYITRLNLCNNKITEEGGMALKTTLRSNHTLTSLDLSGNPIPPSVLEDISTAITINAQPITDRKERPFGRPRPYTCDDPTEFITIQYHSELVCIVILFSP